MDQSLVKLQFTIFGCLLMVAVVLVNGYPRSLDQSEVTQFETRCGWLANPTPANMWLFDRDGQWIIGTQGGYQMEGDDWNLPDFSPRQWVRTNVGSMVTGARVCDFESTDGLMKSLRLQVPARAHYQHVVGIVA